MGIISWVKHKFYNEKLKKAKSSFEEGDVKQAIEILKKILDCHPDAPSTLLSIYHSDIEKGSNQRISDVALLYENHQSLKEECIDFANSLKNDNQIQIHINYCQALYCKGICELLDQFVGSATKIVTEENYTDKLQTLTTNNSLLRSLSYAILTEAQKAFTQIHDLSKSERLCNLIQPYLSSEEFYKLYSNIRFDIIVSKKVTEDSVNQLNILFKDIETAYHCLSNATIKELNDKRLNLAKALFEQNNYVTALLVSKGLTEKYADACRIYAESSLKLYTSSNSNINSKIYLIEDNLLYKCLGDENSVLINSLEPFIPYSTHRQKYISIVTLELSRLVSIRQQKQAESLLNKAWTLIPSNSFIKAVLSNGSSASQTHFASLMLDSDNKFISSNSNLKCYVEEISKFDNIEFILTTLERLLDKGKDIISNYEVQILRSAQKAKFKSRKRIDIIERGRLAKIPNNSRLYASETKYLNDYINSKNYDSVFATNISSSLIGYSDQAEIIIAKILLDEADKNNLITQEKKLREALAIKKVHNKLFDEIAYKTLLPKIQKKITDLAKKLYVTDQRRAIELLYLLRDNDLSWFNTYASLYLDSIQNENGSEEIASKILNIITEGAVEVSPIYNKLWSKYISVKCLIISTKDNNDAISELIKLHYELECQCNSYNKEDLKTKVSSILSKRLFSRAKNYEKNKIYDIAIEDYSRIIRISGSYPDIKARIYICKLKDGQLLLNSDKVGIENLLSTNKEKKYQKDLAYRWCIYLISQGLLKKAEEINERILGTDNEIVQISQEERIKAQQRILDELNEQICKLNKSQLTPEEAITLGQSLSKTLNDISLIVQVPTQKSNILKESIRLYAIEKFYMQGNYLQSFNGLKVQDSTDLSDPIALRNMAIMCLNAAEDGLLTDTNYKELLAIWITAIYQQKIFVDSLNYTSWDDPYIFTLKSALGQLDNKEDELPNNVNYDPPSDNKVISILEVQKSLLLRMETAIHYNFEYQQFFSSQLEAIDKLAEQNLDENCVLVAPYMLQLSNTYKKSITKALTVEANAHYGNWETILEIGNLYGLNNGDFNKYSSALKALSSAIESIEQKQKIKSSFTQTRISLIKEFERLKNKLISAVSTAMHNDISQNIEYRRLNSEYGGVVKMIADDALAFKFSNYINQQVVKTLKDKTQTLAQGAPILFEIYSFCKCNLHLKRNIENIIEALIHNYISEGDEDNITVLNTILSSTREFDTQVVKALKGKEDVPEEMMVLFFYSNESRFNVLNAKIGRKSSVIQNQFNTTAIKISTIKVQFELSQIIDQVNNNKINKYDALQKLYNIYKNNESNVSVCKNLAALISVCIMEYIIPDKDDKSKVETVLDSLLSNMSSTFQAHNSDIGKTYTMIWNQLPYNARNAIENSPWSLNEQGKALKKGLDYLKALK